MSTVTDFRRTLQQRLKTALAVEFVGGRVDSRQEKDLGCVWLDGKRPFPRDGNVEEVTYGVRLFRAWQQPQGDHVLGRNAEQLEADLEALEDALQAILTTTGHDFFNVAARAVDYDRQFVQAELVAYQRNRASAGG